MAETQNEMNIKILEYKIAECNRLIATYDDYNIDEKKIQMQEAKKAKYTADLAKIKS